MRTSQHQAVLYDPHPLWLEALEAILAREQLEIVGKATDSSDVLDLVREHQPRVLVAGLRALNGSGTGLSCISGAVRERPELKVVVIGDSPNLEDIAAAFDAGASAYVLATAQPDEIAVAVRQTLERSVYLASPLLGRRRRESFTHSGSDAGRAQLTRRELEILRFVAEGYSNQQLARMFWVTEQTVKFHLSNVYRKLGVANRTEASRWAQLHGFLTAEPELVPPAT